MLQVHSFRWCEGLVSSPPHLGAAAALGWHALEPFGCRCVGLGGLGADGACVLGPGLASEAGWVWVGGSKRSDPGKAIEDIVDVEPWTRIWTMG